MAHDDAVPAQPPQPPGPSGAAPKTFPFGPLDEAVHLLDTRSAPWSVQLEVRVRGRLDEDRLRGAVFHALASHPMARARKAPARTHGRREDWEVPDEPDLDPLRVVDCPDDAALHVQRERLQSLEVPLVESPPLRLRLARHPDGDLLMVNANHAAMDGFGVLRFVESVARAYAGTPDPEPPAGPADAQEVPFRITASAGARTRLLRAATLVEKLRDLAAPPARIAADGETGSPGYGFHHVSVPREVLAAVAAREGPGTVNDVLLAALHLTIGEWNTRHRARCRRVSVLVPGNLRPAEWRSDVVGNLSAPGRISTTRRDRASPHAAIAAVVAQTERQKRVGMGTPLLEVLTHSPLLPLRAKRALVALLPATGNRLVDTAMLSNLGRIEEPPAFGGTAGDTEELWMSPPARMPLGLTVGVVTLGGRLHVVFRYRRALFDAEAAARFAGMYVAALRGYADEGRRGRHAGARE